MVPRLVPTLIGSALAVFAFICNAGAVTAILDSPPPGRVAELLFRGVAGVQSLSAADMVSISALLPIAVRDNVFVDTTCKNTSHVRVAIRDLNGDGRPEVIVSEGNACVYGMVGSAMHVIAIGRDGTWREILRGDGDSFKEVARGPHTWPTILPAVRGFCYPAYDYSDAKQAYVLTKHVPDPARPGACQDRQ